MPLLMVLSDGPFLMQRIVTTVRTWLVALHEWRLPSAIFEGGQVQECQPWNLLSANPLEAVHSLVL